MWVSPYLPLRIVWPLSNCYPSVCYQYPPSPPPLIIIIIIVIITIISHLGKISTKGSLS